MSGNMALKCLPLSSTIISWLTKERMSAFSLKWPPGRYFAWLLNKNAFMPMPYNHACDTENGEPVYLTRSLSGGLKVALCELTYYHQWYNIRGVGRVSHEHTAVLVPDGYYNARVLDEEVFKTLGAKLHLDTHTGLLQITTKNDKIMMSSELAKVFGFTQNTFEGAKCSLEMV